MKKGFISIFGIVVITAAIAIVTALAKKLAVQ